MAIVQKVELDIQYPVIGPNHIAKVHVRSFLAFEPGEIGRVFHLSITLFGSDIGENPKAALLKPGQLYVFSFGVQTSGQGSSPLLRNENYDVVRVTSASVVHDAERDITISVLDEDPGVDRKLVPGTPAWTLPIYLVTPRSDEIYAVSELFISATSNIVQMKYAPLVEQ